MEESLRPQTVRDNKLEIEKTAIDRTLRTLA
jgi:hypothetical protein